MTIHASRKGEVLVSMSTRNVELMLECSPEHLRMGMKQDKDTENEIILGTEEYEKSEYGKKNSGQLSSSWGRYSTKQWINYLTNLTFSIDLSTTPWGGGLKQVFTRYNYERNDIFSSARNMQTDSRRTLARPLLAHAW